MTFSTFRAWSECPLKAVLIANKFAESLPRHPRAILGSIAHAVIERVQQNDSTVPLTDNELAAFWDEEVYKEEAAIRLSTHSELEAPLLPLSESCPKFERTRLSTLRLAKRVIADSLRQSPWRQPRQTVEMGHSSPVARTEQWVSARDATVGGIIDVLIWRDGDLVIRDYKTGEVMDRAGDVKTTYVEQLHFYAALCNESIEIGRWPSTLEIVDSRGSIVPVELDKDQATSILDSAVVALHELRLRTAEALAGNLRLEDLARPQSAKCEHCGFRPECTAYRNQLCSVGKIEHESGSVDIAGKIVRIEQHEQQARIQLDSGFTIGGCMLGPAGDSRCGQITTESIGKMVEFFELRTLGRWHSMLQMTVRSVARCQTTTTAIGFGPPMSNPREVAAD